MESGSYKAVDGTELKLEIFRPEEADGTTIVFFFAQPNCGPVEAMQISAVNFQIWPAAFSLRFCQPDFEAGRPKIPQIWVF